MHKKNHGTNLLKSVHKFQRFCFAYMHSYWYILLLHIHKPFLNSFAQLLLLGSESISLTLLKNPILFCNAFLVESFSSSWKNMFFFDSHDSLLMQRQSQSYKDKQVCGNTQFGNYKLCESSNHHSCNYIVHDIVMDWYLLQWKDPL